MKIIKCQLMKTTGEITEPEPKNGKHFSYEELKEFVGGMVEIVPLPDNHGSIVVNEEGKLIGLEINQKATEFWKDEYPIKKYPINNDQLIVGDALVVFDESLLGDEE